jgi:hypothetical protein
MISLLIISIVILLLSLFRLIQVRSIMNDFEATEGEIIEIKEFWNSEYQSYDKVPIWRYITQKGETIINEKLLIGLTDFSTVLGEKQKIHYKRTNPQKAILDYRPYKFLILPSLFAIISTLTIILVLVSISSK